MSIEPYALANSRPPSLHAVRAEPNLLQTPHPLSGQQRAAPHFGRVEPDLQRGPDRFGALRRAVLSWRNSISAAKEDATLHDRRPALARPPSLILSEALHRGGLGNTSEPEALRAKAACDLAERRIPTDPFPAKPPSVHVSLSESRTRDTQPLLLIEHVKQLLDQQRIRDARRTLAVGSIHYPANLQIAGLLRAISPGRVSPTGWASSGRERETDWIRRNGQKYRGKWIALDEDRLIAFAGNLSELLADLDASADQEKPPFIQHLHSE